MGNSVPPSTESINIISVSSESNIIPFVRLQIFPPGISFKGFFYGFAHL